MPTERNLQQVTLPPSQLAAKLAWEHRPSMVVDDANIRVYIAQ